MFSHVQWYDVDTNEIFILAVGVIFQYLSSRRETEKQRERETEREKERERERESNNHKY